MCGGASGWSQLSLVLLALALAVHVAGWATTAWMTYETTNGVISVDVGLWQMESCTSGSCTSASVADQYATDAFNAVRAMETVAFCLSVLALVLLLVYVCSHVDGRHSFALVLLVLMYAAGTLSFIGMLIFVTNVPSPFDVSWSLGLTVIALTLMLICGTLMIPDAFEPDYISNNDRNYERYFGKNRPNSRGVTPISFKDHNNRWANY